MENRAHALAAGVFVVILCLAAALTVWWFGGTHSVTRDLVLVTQRNVTGLNPLAQVRYRGITAGKVISIGLNPQDPRTIEVLVRIDASLPLTRGTTAQLNSQGITGLSYVHLDDNGKNTELLPVDDDNPPRVALQQTLMESLGDKASDIAGQIGVLANNLNRVLDDKNLRNLSRTLDNLATASEGMRDVPQLVDSVKAILSRENLQRLQSILVHLEKTAGETAPLTLEMRKLVGSMQTLTIRLDETTVKLGGELTASTLPQIGGLVADLQTSSRQLRRVLEQLEVAPQSLVFGPPAPQGGPGEAGFISPEKSSP